MRRACARLLLAGIICLLGGQASAQTASLRFTQGVNVGASGQALKGVVGTAVTIANSSSVGIQSWQIDVYYAPPGSSLAIGTLAANDNNTTPVATFTPDKPGGYRFGLKVWSATGRHGNPVSVDYRTFLIGGRTNGFVAPPWQGWPLPLPPLASGLPGAKADEINPAGCTWGYAGCGAGDGLLNDFIATVDSKLQKTVANMTALAALDTTDASNGLLVYVTTVGDWFELIPSTGAPAQPFVLVAALDGRQWQRRGVPNQKWTHCLFWSVGPGGSDEAVGCGTSHAASDAVKLATMGELNRRLTGWDGSVVPGWDAGIYPTAAGISVHLTGDIDAASFAVLSNLKAKNAVNFSRVIGTLTAVDGGASNRTITDYQAAVPASNTERILTISGLGATPQYVGMMIQRTDGAKTAWVSRQPATNQLSISEPTDMDAALNGGTPVDFVVSEHVTIYKASLLPDWPFPATGVEGLLSQVWLNAEGSGFEAWTNGNIGAGAVAYMAQDQIGSLTPFAIGVNLHGGGNQSMISTCALYGNHGNQISDATWSLFSVLDYSVGDGIFFDNSTITIGNELLFTSGGSGGQGFRSSGTTGKNTFNVQDDGVIAAFGTVNAVFSLAGNHSGTHGALVGHFVSNTAGGYSRWYGSGNTGPLLVVPQGTQSVFPKVGITVTTSNSNGPVNLAGVGAADTDPTHWYPFSSMPIVDLSTLTTLGDSSTTVH